MTADGTPVKLSIVVLCWNSRSVIGDCLGAIERNPPEHSYEVIVVDNASSDGTADLVRSAFPAARLLALQDNKGFSAGNNIGIREARGEYVLILNPDAFVARGALSALLAFADSRRECGAFACRVLNPDGTYQHSARPFPTLARLWAQALFWRYLAFDPDRYFRWSGETEREIDWTAGCCLLVRRSVLDELEGFDERFFYHYEDVDLCKRIRDRGYSIRYTPSARVVHAGNRPGSLPLALELEKYRNRYRYFRKHHGRSATWHCRWSQTVRYSTRAALFLAISFVAREKERWKTSAVRYWQLSTEIFGGRPESDDPGRKD